MRILRYVCAIGITLTCAQIQAEDKFDVLVYGATPSGVSAATNAGRQGLSVLLVEETYQVGGMTAGGLSHTDFLTIQSLGGTWKEFMDRVQEHYRRTFGDNSPQHRQCCRGGFYEPKVARLVFEEMLADGGVTTLLQHRIVTAEVNGNRLSSATFVPTDATGGYPRPRLDQPSRNIEARVFIDATYEGDLLEAAGVPYRLGTDPRSLFSESLAPLTGSDAITATNFRVCLTRDPQRRLPIPKPSDYDRKRYQVILEMIEDETLMPSYKGGTPWPLDQFLRVRSLPNRKADFNDRKGSRISIKLVEETHAWPTASAEQRASLFALAKNRALGFFWFMGHDPELPQWARDGMNLWGLPRDEFEMSGHWSPVLYVREGRRMIGAKTFTQHDTQPTGDQSRAKLNVDSVAIGDYNINSHGTHFLPDGTLGGNLSRSVRPFQIPYEVMVPERIDGLLASVPISASHVGYCAIRMEPTWTALGQAAGHAAALAVKDNVKLRDVSISELQLQLHAEGAFTVYLGDVPATSPYFRAAQFFGTLGFFHELDDSTTVPGFFSGPPCEVSSQWSDVPRKGHSVGIDKAISRSLAESWLRQFAKRFPGAETGLDTVERFNDLSRGEFLNQLYEDAIAANNSD